MGLAVNPVTGKLDLVGAAETRSAAVETFLDSLSQSEMRTAVGMTAAGSSMVTANLATDQFKILLLAGSGNIGINTAVNPINLGTINDTTARPFCIEQLWNNASLSARGLLVKITNTTSASTSRPFLLEVGGVAVGGMNVAGGFLATSSGSTHPAFGSLANPTFGLYFESSRMSVRDGPNMMMAFGTSASTVGLQLGSTRGVHWGAATPDGGCDSGINRFGAGILGLVTTYTGASSGATAFQVYRTRTDASNYERMTLQSGSGYFEVAAETLGTGTDDLSVRITPSGAGSARIGTASSKVGFFGNDGAVLPAGNNTSGHAILNAGTAINDQTTFNGGSGNTYTIQGLVAVLKSLNLIS
jgi:hypothetical protein